MGRHQPRHKSTSAHLQRALAWVRYFMIVIFIIFEGTVCYIDKLNITWTNDQHTFNNCVNIIIITLWRLQQKRMRGLIDLWAEKWVLHTSYPCVFFFQWEQPLTINLHDYSSFQTDSSLSSLFNKPCNCTPIVLMLKQYYFTIIEHGLWSTCLILISIGFKQSALLVMRS